MKEVEIHISREDGIGEAMAVYLDVLVSFYSKYSSR